MAVAGKCSSKPTTSSFYVYISNMAAPTTFDFSFARKHFAVSMEADFLKNVSLYHIYVSGRVCQK